MRSNLETVLSKIFGHEGEFSNRPLSQDPGGPTKWGVTQKTLRAWRGGNVSVDDVRNLTLKEAAEIYRKQYAAPVRFDDLPSGLDYVMLDYAINSGPAQAVKTLQRVLGVSPVDGVMGLKTMAAVRAANDNQTINKVQDARLAFMRGLKNWSTNRNGWTIRVASVRKAALAMVAPRKSATLTEAAKARLEEGVPAERNIVSDVTPDFSHEAAMVQVDGGDAKALPAETRVTATPTGAGIATAGGGGIVATALDTLRPMIGGGGTVDKIFVALTLVSMAVALYGLYMAYKAHHADLRSGAPI